MLAAVALASLSLAYAQDGVIRTIDADGANRTRVTEGRTAQEPAWSPDGSRLAYVRITGENRSELRVVAADGSSDRRLLALRGGFAQPAWSPDGSRLAFVFVRLTERRLTTAVETLTLEDGRRRRLASRDLFKDFTLINDVVWRPDGAGLLYSLEDWRRDPIDSDLRRISDGGTGDRLFLRHARGGSYSPDGTQLAFGDTSTENGESCGSDQCFANAEVAVVDADGSNRRRLMRTLDDESDAAWSPDGARIAFSSARNVPELSFGAPNELYTIAADGSCLTRLTNGSPDSRSPAWRPGSAAAATACGDLAPQPTVLTRPPRRGVWLGPRFGPAIFAGARRSLVFYDDCAAFDPAGCGPMFSLSVSRGCRHGQRRARLRRAVRSGQGLTFDDGPRFGSVLVGRWIVTVEVDTAIGREGAQKLYRRIARALRPVGSGALGRPRLKRSDLDELPRRLRDFARAC